MKYIVWDWNGTLLDDTAVCVEVENRLLRRRGLPPLTMERYREIFTFPVREYYRAAGLDLDKEPFEEVAEEFIRDYNRSAAACGLFPGTRAVLDALNEAGFVQLIASASAKAALVEQVEHCGVTDCFQALLGVGDSLAAGKEGLARAYLEQRGARPEQVIFIGDTVHDWEVAQSMGCRCVLIAGGHQSRARLEAVGAPVLDSIEEVPGWLQSMEA